MKKTAEERIAALHARMDALRRARERRKTIALSAADIFLAACLILTVMIEGKLHSAASAGLYSGAILLFEGSGGYVLTAVIAFFAGAVLTLVIRWLLKRRADIDGKMNDGKDDDGGSL